MNKSQNVGTLFAASAAILFAIGGLVAAIANPPPPSSPNAAAAAQPQKTQSPAASPSKLPTTKSPAITIISNPAATGTKSKSGSSKPAQAPKPQDDHNASHAPKDVSAQHAPSSTLAASTAQASPTSGQNHGHAPVQSVTPAANEPAVHAAPSQPVSNPDEALAFLVDGNTRWAEGKVTAPNTQAQRREELAAHGQTPFVTIVTCSDSRIPVERVFDRGIGDLFVIRVAGNRAASSEVGTVEYGVEHLKTPLLVVMGHTKCGAVAAAVSGAQLHGKVAELVAGIQPAVDRARKSNPGADEATLVSASIRENVWQTIFDLYKSSPQVRTMAANGTLKVVGATYDISSGKVEFLGEHPWQSELFAAMTTTSSPATQAKAPAHDKAYETHDVHDDVHATAPADDHK